MNCSNTRLNLVLATTDPALYSPQSKWSWNGQMYWAVECLPSEQTTVSDRVAPLLDSARYAKLTDSPAVWNSSSSDSLQLIFTFKPGSPDPGDYLQYVIDLFGHVTDRPHHTIADNAGNKLYLDIVEVSRSPKLDHVEVWIAKAQQVQEMTVKKIGSAIAAKARTAGNTGLTSILIYILITVLLFLLLSSIGWWLYF
jgi:hypothetical protein